VLPKREESYRTLFENLTQGAFRQLADGTLTDVNEAALAMFGLTREEFLNRTSESTAWNVVREDGSPFPGTEHPSMEALRTGRPVRGVVCGALNERTQARVWVEVNAIPEFRPGDSNPHQVTVTLHDVTAHRRVEEALLFKENIIRCSSSAIATCDLDGKMTYGNPSFLNIWGFDDPSEFLGRSFWQFWQVSARLDEIMQSLLGKGRWFGEVKAVRKTGEHFDVQVSAASVLDGRGRPVALTSSSTDITERKRAQESLRESELLLRLAVQTAGLAIWDWDMVENRVRWANSRKTPFEGAPKDGTDYEWWAERIHPEDRGAVISSFDNALAGRRESLVLEYRFRRGDGGWANIHDRCQIIREASGKASRVIGAVLDVTALSRAEEELRRSRDDLAARILERTAELAEANRELRAEIVKRERVEQELRQSQKMEAMGTLTSGIAHDFNNILTPIVVNSELALTDVPAGSAVHNNLELILKSGIRGKNLVKQLLLFSRKSEQEHRVFHLIPLVRDSFGLLRSSIPSTIQMRFDPETEADLLNADPSQIQQVIVNLCMNAAYAMRGTAGSIDISLQGVGLGPADLPDADMRPGGYLALSVKDSGPGMSGEVRNRIFEPFFTTKPAGEGTGLGLSVVYGIVKAHKGGITVSNEPGRGCAFRVFLPSVDKGVSLATKIPDPMPGGTERILIVDDEKIITHSLRAMLEHLGYEVYAVTESPAALTLFSKDPSQFDLVITDQTMPLLTGVELGKELMRLRSDIPVILCTGYSDLISSQEIMGMGFRGFIMKPFTFREGAELVRRVLDGNRPG